MIDDEKKSLGQIAFEASTPDKLTWEDLDVDTQAKWESIAQTVIDTTKPVELPYDGDPTITAYAVIPPVDAPKGSKEALEAKLIDAGLTGVTVTLEAVNVKGYSFAITADGNNDSAAILEKFFGVINVTGTKAVDPSIPAEKWQVAGTWNGRFAQENPPPAHARFPK